MGSPKRFGTWLSVAVAAALLSACGSAPPEDPGPAVPDPGTPVRAAPATDCSGSTSPVAVSAALADLVQAKTDPTGTSLLVTNVGLVSLIVVPDSSGSTRLQSTPFLAPTDEADRLTFEALLHSNVFAYDPDIPPGVPRDQVYVVPPGYSVCGTTGTLAAPAGVQVRSDRLASAAWRLGHALADRLIGLLTPAFVRRSDAVKACVSDALGILHGQPDLSDLTLYTSALGTATTCYRSVSWLFEQAGQAPSEAQQTRTAVVDVLERLPKLIDDARFLRQLAR